MGASVIIGLMDEAASRGVTGFQRSAAYQFLQGTGMVAHREETQPVANP